jgi:hypothetical protein
VLLLNPGDDLQSDHRSPSRCKPGDERQRFDQQAMSPAEAERVFADYFAIFSLDQLPPDAAGFDMG